MFSLSHTLTHSFSLTYAYSLPTFSALFTLTVSQSQLCLSSPPSMIRYSSCLMPSSTHSATPLLNTCRSGHTHPLPHSVEHTVGVPLSLVARSSIPPSPSLQAIDVFLSEARDSLSVRPQTVEEIGQVNMRHAELARRKPEVAHKIRHIHV